MAFAPFIHARCCYNPIFGAQRTGSSHGPVGTSSFSSSSSSSSCTPSSPCSSSSDSNHSWRLPGFGPQAMSTSTLGTFSSSSSIGNVKNEPDHLLVLVHGIMASPSDWTYFEAELKRRLGRNYLIYGTFFFPLSECHYPMYCKHVHIIIFLKFRCINMKCNIYDFGIIVRK
ncbi:uncharacterized protein LOC120082701 [Benincasa hispida]|uniref:uncharacterized protein LOC120082701 n=1 Tax=Benincasa hispida TaxID=102211 RepID=UPI00190085B1|nr:uncharacterized protein LOC120082701 [Benincasa hispida]